MRARTVLQLLFCANCTLFLFGVLRVFTQSNHYTTTLKFTDGDDLNLRSTLTGYEHMNSNRTSEFKVPNIVHYIWYNTKPEKFRFHHMLSMLSAYKFIRPDVIYFHTDYEPVGIYWEQARRIPRVQINYRKPPFTLFGEKVKEPMFYTSHSNVDRVKILMEFGGIYLDLDVLVTNSFDELRKYSCVIGQEQETKACGSVIVCEKTSFFLYLWINSYLDDYRMEEWAYNTGQVPFNLARRFPHLAYMEPTKLNHPNFKELDQIWGSAPFNWKENYAVHIWYRLWKRSKYYDGIEPDPETIKGMKNAFGEMARTIYYGSPDIIPSDVHQ